MIPVINIEVSDQATPVLAAIEREITDRQPLNEYIGTAAAEGTRMHLRSAAQSRHETSARLGASPTGYLTKRAELVSYTASSSDVVLSLTGAIFKRVFGPVTVKPREKQWLAIPAVAEAYGRRARELEGLFFVLTQKGVAMLARADGDKKIKAIYWLKKSVVLPQDRGLLPTEEQYTQMAEFAARGYLRKVQRGMGL